MGRVLIADNDAMRSESLAAMLLGEGAEVCMASTGQEAYEVTREMCPELVFLDVALPVFSGIEVAAMLRNDPDVSSGLRIVLISRTGISPTQAVACGADLALENLPDYGYLRELLSQMAL